MLSARDLRMTIRVDSHWFRRPSISLVTISVLVDDGMESSSVEFCFATLQLSWG